MPRRPVRPGTELAHFLGLVDAGSVNVYGNYAWSPCHVKKNMMHPYPEVATIVRGDWRAIEPW